MAQATARIFYGAIFPDEKIKKLPLHKIVEKWESVEDKFPQIGFMGFADSENTKDEDMGWALYVNDSVMEIYNCFKLERDLELKIDPKWAYYFLKAVKECGWDEIDEMKIPGWCVGVDFQP